MHKISVPDSTEDLCCTKRYRPSNIIHTRFVDTVSVIDIKYTFNEFKIHFLFLFSSFKKEQNKPRVIAWGFELG